MRLSLASRITAVLSSVLLVQLMLLASGTLCRMHADHANAMRGAAEHAGHMRAAAHGPRADDRATVRTEDASPGMPAGSCGMSGSCGTPWAPGGGCASMGSCITAVSALPVSAAFAGNTAPQHVRVLVSAALPRGPTFAPELPPPRA